MIKVIGVHEILARLMEEVWELAREVNHRFGPKKKKDTKELGELGEEMADIIYTVIFLANSFNIDLDLYFEKMMEKYDTRDKGMWKKSDIVFVT